MYNSFPERSIFSTSFDLVCFSHLRWDFVFQRPQHLLTRFAKKHRVFFIEEPFFHKGPSQFQIDKRENGLHVIVPQINDPNNLKHIDGILKSELDSLLERQNIREFVSWYYTPMMINWSRHLRPQAVVYDCMDELSAFKNAPQALRVQESELMSMSDLVFTGGQSLYEAKRERHHSVHCFPSSIDAHHFATALAVNEQPHDQAEIPHPRIGFYGVIDERTDIELLRAIAESRPEWHFIMIGPVAKIADDDLPRAANLHYLGAKKYEQLPEYLAGWDVAMMPFALNESTRFISPTKTPEYLAAGRPVVSTPIRDVVRPYGEAGLVHIASTPGQFVHAIEMAMSEDQDQRMTIVKNFLQDRSWDQTQAKMSGLIENVIQSRSVKTSAVAV